MREGDKAKSSGEAAKERQIRKPVDSVKANLPELNKGQSRDEAAKIVNISPRSVETAKDTGETNEAVRNRIRRRKKSCSR